MSSIVQILTQRPSFTVILGVLIVVGSYFVHISSTPADKDKGVTAQDSDDDDNDDEERTKAKAKKQVRKQVLRRSAQAKQTCTRRVTGFFIDSAVAMAKLPFYVLKLAAQSVPHIAKFAFSYARDVMVICTAIVISQRITPRLLEIFNAQQQQNDYGFSPRH